MLLAIAFFGLLICQSIFVWVVLDQKDKLAERLESLDNHAGETTVRLMNFQRQFDVLEVVANYAKDNARMARKAAEEAQKAIDAHEAEMARQRAANEQAAQRASKPRRRAHDRD